jgi:hypothetical protein
MRPYYKVSGPPCGVVPLVALLKANASGILQGRGAFHKGTRLVHDAMQLIAEVQGG